MIAHDERPPWRDWLTREALAERQGKDRLRVLWQRWKDFWHDEWWIRETRYVLDVFGLAVLKLAAFTTGVLALCLAAQTLLMPPGPPVWTLLAGVWAAFLAVACGGFLRRLALRRTIP